MGAQKSLVYNKMFANITCDFPRPSYKLKSSIIVWNVLGNYTLFQEIVI